MITGGNSTTSTNYTPASCIHKQCNLCPIDLSNSFNRSTLWPPSFCLPPCSPLCSMRAERGKPSKSFCTPRVPLNNESYLATREETRRRAQIRRRQFSEPAKTMGVGKAVRESGSGCHEGGDRAEPGLFVALSRIGNPTPHLFFCGSKTRRRNWRLQSNLILWSDYEASSPWNVVYFTSGATNQHKRY